MAHTFKTLTIVTALVVPLCAEAQDGTRLAAAAEKLGITQDEFMACLPESALQGQRPPQSERRKVLSCLKAANPGLTNSDIRSAMQDLQG